MTRPGARRDPASGQWWMFTILFVLFLAGAVWLFSRGQSTGGILATVVAVLDGGAAVALYLRSRRNRRS
jgi:hypothetical protein